MKNHNYLMALAMNSDVGTLHLSNADIPVKITEVESNDSPGHSPMTTFKCLVVNDDQIQYHAPNRNQTRVDPIKEAMNRVYGAGVMNGVPRRSGRYPWGMNIPTIDRVIFNNPATIVIWADGTKTVVKCQEGDVYSKETGLALCIAKKALGNQGNFNNVFHEWIPEEEEAECQPEPVTVQMDASQVAAATTKQVDAPRKPIKKRRGWF